MNVISCNSPISQNELKSTVVTVYCEKSVDILEDSLQFCFSSCMTKLLLDYSAVSDPTEVNPAESVSYSGFALPDNLTSVNLLSEGSIWNFIASQQHILICISLSESIYIVTKTGIVINGVTSALNAFLSCINFVSASPSPTSIRFSLCCFPGISSPVDIIAISSTFSYTSTASLVSIFCSQLEQYFRFRYSTLKSSFRMIKPAVNTNTPCNTTTGADYQVLDLLYDVALTLAPSCQQKLLIITDGAIDYLLSPPYEYCKSTSGSFPNKQQMSVDFLIVDPNSEAKHKSTSLHSIETVGYLDKVGCLFDIIAERGGFGSVWNRFGEEMENTNSQTSQTKRSYHLRPIGDDRNLSDVSRLFSYIVHIPIVTSLASPPQRNRSATMIRIDSSMSASNSSTWSYSRPPLVKPVVSAQIVSTPSSLQHVKKISIGGIQNLKFISLVSIMSHRIKQGYKLFSVEFSSSHMSGGKLEGLVCRFLMEKNLSGLVNIISAVDFTLVSNCFDSTAIGCARIRYEVSAPMDVIFVINSKLKAEFVREQQLYFSDCIYDTISGHTLTKILLEVRKIRRSDETIGDVFKWLRVMDDSVATNSGFLMFPNFSVGDLSVSMFDLLKSYQFVSCVSDSILIAGATAENGIDKGTLEFDVISKSFVETLNSKLANADILVSRSFWSGCGEVNKLYVWDVLRSPNCSCSYSRCLTRMEIETVMGECGFEIGICSVRIKISCLFVTCPPAIRKSHYESILSNCKNAIDCIPLLNGNLLSDACNTVVLPHFVESNLDHVKRSCQLDCVDLQPKPSRFKMSHQLSFIGVFSSECSEKLIWKEMDCVLSGLCGFLSHFQQWVLLSCHLPSTSLVIVSVQLANGFRSFSSPRPLFENLDDEDDSDEERKSVSSTPATVSDIFNLSTSDSSSRHSSYSRSPNLDGKMNDVSFCCMTKIQYRMNASDSVPFFLHSTMFASPFLGSSKELQKLATLNQEIQTDFVAMWNVIASILSSRKILKTPGTIGDPFRSFMLSAPSKRICAADFEICNDFDSEHQNDKLKLLLMDCLLELSENSITVTDSQDNSTYVIITLSDIGEGLEKEVMLVKLSDRFENFESPIVRFAPSQSECNIRKVGLEAILCSTYLMRDFHTVKMFCRLQDHGHLLDNIDDGIGMPALLHEKLSNAAAILEKVSKKALSRYFFQFQRTNLSHESNTQCLSHVVLRAVLSTCFTPKQSVPNLSGILKQTVDGSVWNGLDDSEFASFCSRFRFIMLSNDNQAVGFQQIASSNVFAVETPPGQYDDQFPMFVSFEVSGNSNDERNISEKLEDSLALLKSNIWLLNSAFKVLIWTSWENCTLSDLVLRELTSRLRRASLIEYISQVRLQNVTVQKAMGSKDIETSSIPQWIVSSVKECMMMLSESDVASMIMPITVVHPKLSGLKLHKQSEQLDWSNYVDNAANIIENLLENDEYFRLSQSEGKLHISIARCKNAEGWCLFKLQSPNFVAQEISPVAIVENKSSHKMPAQVVQPRIAREGEFPSSLRGQTKLVPQKAKTELKGNAEDELAMSAISRTTSIDVSESTYETNEQEWITFKLHLAIENTKTLNSSAAQSAALKLEEQNLLASIQEVVDRIRRKANQLILLQCLFDTHLACSCLIPLPSLKHFQVDLEDPNAFHCPCVHTISFPIFHRLRVETALTGLADSALQPLWVENRSNTYVYKDNRGHIYYMVLKGYPLQVDSRCDVSSYFAIEVNVHGIPGQPVGEDISVHLKEVLESALHDLALQALSSLLAVNAHLPMKSSDLKFLTGESEINVPPTYFSFDLPKFVSDEYHFLMYLLQNFNMSSYINRINVQSEIVVDADEEEKTLKENAYRDVFQDSRSALSAYDSSVIHPAFTGRSSIVSTFLGSLNQNLEIQCSKPVQDCSIINPAFFGYDPDNSKRHCVEFGSDLADSKKGWYVELKRSNFTYLFNSTQLVSSGAGAPIISSSLTSKGAIIVKQAGNGIALFDFFPMNCSEASDPVFPWFLSTGKQEWVEDDVQELLSTISNKGTIAVTKRNNVIFKNTSIGPSQLCLTMPTRTIVVRLFATSSLKLPVVAQIIEFCMNQALHDYAIEKLLSIKRLDSVASSSPSFQSLCPSIIHCLQSSAELVNPSTEVLKITQRLPLWCYTSLGRDLVSCLNHRHECLEKYVSCNDDTVFPLIEGLVVQPGGGENIFGHDHGSAKVSHSKYSTFVFGGCCIDLATMLSKKMMAPDSEMLYPPVYCDTETACVLPLNGDRPPYSWRQWIMLVQFSPSGLCLYAYNLQKSISTRAREMCQLTMNEVASRESVSEIARMTSIGLGKILRSSYMSITVSSTLIQMSKIEADFKQRRSDINNNNMSHKYHYCHGNAPWQLALATEFEKAPPSPSNASQSTASILSKAAVAPKKSSAIGQLDAVQMAQIAARKRAQAHNIASPSKKNASDSVSSPVAYGSKFPVTDLLDDGSKLDSRSKKPEKSEKSPAAELYPNESILGIACCIPSEIAVSEITNQEMKRFPPAAFPLTSLVSRSKFTLCGPFRRCLDAKNIGNLVNSLAMSTKNGVLTEKLLLDLINFTQNSHIVSVSSCKIFSQNWYEHSSTYSHEENKEHSEPLKSPKSSRMANAMFEVFKRFVSRFTGCTDSKLQFIGLTERLPTGCLLSSNKLLYRLFGLAMFHLDVPNTSVKLIIELRAIEADNHDVIIVELCKAVDLSMSQFTKSISEEVAPSFIGNLNQWFQSSMISKPNSLFGSHSLTSNHCTLSTVTSTWRNTNLIRCVFDFILGSVWKLIVPSTKSVESQIVRHSMEMICLASGMVRNSFGKFYKGKFQMIDKIISIPLPGRCVSFSSVDNGYVVDERELLSFISVREGMYDVKRIKMSETMAGLARTVILDKIAREDYVFQSFSPRPNIQPPIMFILSHASSNPSNDKILQLRVFVIINKNQLDDENSRRYPTTMNRPNAGFLTCLMNFVEESVARIVSRAAIDFSKECGWNFFNCYIRGKCASSDFTSLRNNAAVYAPAALSATEFSGFLSPVSELSTSIEVKTLDALQNKSFGALWDPHLVIDWVDALMYLNRQYVRCALLETELSSELCCQLFISCDYNAEVESCDTTSILHLLASNKKLISCKLLRRSSDVSDSSEHQVNVKKAPGAAKKTRKRFKKLDEEEYDEESSVGNSRLLKPSKAIDIDRPVVVLTADEQSSITRILGLVLNYIFRNI